MSDMRPRLLSRPLACPRLNGEFNKMWQQTMSKLTFSKPKKENIFTNVSFNLRQNLSRKGSRACKLLSEKKLEDCGHEPFKVTVEGFWNRAAHKMSNLVNHDDQVMQAQKMAKRIIDACKQVVDQKLLKHTNYHETDIQEILHLIDDKLGNEQDVDVDINFEVSLKQHICGSAARNFQRMHEEFLQVNDPHTCLNQNKNKFCADFKDLFHRRGQCQKKAEEFTNQCLKPAVKRFVNRSLGSVIMDEMITKEQFRTRAALQFSLLLDLLAKDRFEDYDNYISTYENYVENWIFNQIASHFLDGSKMAEFENNLLQSSINILNAAIGKAKSEESKNVKMFVQNICKELGDKLVISQDALGAFMILNNSDKDQFAHWLTTNVNDMKETLRREFKILDIKMKLQHLHVKPQKELFIKQIGCGRQYPFCKSPCEAGASLHNEHFTKLHQPQGLGRYKWYETKKLVTDICTSSVASDTQFHCDATKGEWHPYKRYREIFPDWSIPSDASYQASDYWKYVMVKFNANFAKKYKTNSADIPHTWHNISLKHAEDSLRKTYNKPL